MVLVFVSKNALDRLSVNNFSLGGDVSIAVGPLGRDVQAGTDYQLKSEVYSYSRSRGVFAGLVLEGASMTIDNKSNLKVFAVSTTTRSLLTSDGRLSPKVLLPYVNALNKISP
jgi:lipid-binding SYLF domain-containing protein